MGDVLRNETSFKASATKDETAAYQVVVEVKAQQAYDG